jgi:hypothetical protein
MRIGNLCSDEQKEDYSLDWNVTLYWVLEQNSPKKLYLFTCKLVNKFCVVDQK